MGTIRTKSLNLIQVSGNEGYLMNIACGDWDETEPILAVHFVIQWYNYIGYKTNKRGLSHSQQNWRR